MVIKWHRGVASELTHEMLRCRGLMGQIRPLITENVRDAEREWYDTHNVPYVSDLYPEGA